MLINTVTVLGANGSMGRCISGIFASFGNAKVYMVCRSLETAQIAAKQAAKSVKADAILQNLIPRTYDDLSVCLKQSDLVIESVAEDARLKKNIYAKIENDLPDHAIVATGTSGLSIQSLSESFTPNTRSRFMGMHFFNPPYSMTLCEIIPSTYTDFNIMQEMESYLSTMLLRNVVACKDKPAFIGNRVGFYLINLSMIYAEKYKDLGGIDYIDAVMGGFSGRNMPPLATSDFVGLDVHKAITDNILLNSNDVDNTSFKLPEFAEELIRSGNLGRKSGRGLYETRIDSDGNRERFVYDINTRLYRKIAEYKFTFAAKMVNSLHKGDYHAALDTLANDTSSEAKLCLELLLKYTLYGLYIARNVGEDIRSTDIVMATGFNWIPPLALIDAFGGSSKFSALTIKYLGRDYIARVDFDGLLNNVPKSYFDFRQFLKAKL